MAWRQQQIRTKMSWARRQRDQELWDALNTMQDELRREKASLRSERMREISRSWPEVHLHYWRSKADDRSRICRNTSLLSASLVEGWHKGIPPQRSLAWYVAQKRPLDPTMVASVLHRCKTPFIAWEFFSWAAKFAGFHHTSTTCVMLFRAYFLGNQPDAAIKFFKREVPALCNPSELLYNVLIQGLCLAGRVPEALELYNEMTGVCCVPRPGRDTNAILRDGLARNGFSVDDQEAVILPSERRKGPKLKANRKLRFKQVVLTKKKLILSCRKSPTLRVKPPKGRSWRLLSSRDLLLEES